MTYQAPIDDIRFALEAAARVWRVRDAGRHDDLDPELLSAILQGAGALAAETLAPLNWSGDREGVRLEGDRVRSASGFAAAYREFRDGGWMGLSSSPAFGGQGLPGAVALAVFEMIHSANMSFGLCPMLTLGAIETIASYGSPEQQATYLPPLISGAWTGTMNLTEPQAGSDLGTVATRATLAADGSYRITGQKIFITWGEHDLTDNIIHLVLARVEGAPGGSKGLSLFIVPKVLADGARNGVRCVGVEHKLGIHASPTCSMSFENATGFLLGEENKGLASMFTMMNAARLNVGMEGVGVAEAAYQKALTFARDRVQGGRAIIGHPDVRRMLATMRAKIQVGRALCYATAVAADCGDHEREGLLTPLAKAWCTDMGVEAASIGVQIHGGMGFVEETGAAQYFRDARIAPIYEGTNGIQAIDLVGRKVQGDGGAAMRTLIAEVHDVATRAGGKAGARLREAAAALETATQHILSVSRDDAQAGAATYLAMAAKTAGAAFVLDGLTQSPNAEISALMDFFGETTLALAPARLAAVKISAGQIPVA